MDELTSKGKKKQANKQTKTDMNRYYPLLKKKKGGNFSHQIKLRSVKLTQWFFSLQDLELIILLCSLLILKRSRGHLGAPQVALEVKNPPAIAGDIRDTGSVTGLGRSPRGGHGNPFLHSCLKNPMGRGDQQATSTGSQSQTQ